MEFFGPRRLQGVGGEVVLQDSSRIRSGPNRHLRPSVDLSDLSERRVDRRAADAATASASSAPSESLASAVLPLLPPSPSYPLESNAEATERLQRAALRQTGAADGPPMPSPSTFRAALTRHLALMAPPTAALLHALAECEHAATLFDVR